MTSIRIDVHDDNRSIQPNEPWTAKVTVGDTVTPEEVANGDSPLTALHSLLMKAHDLLDSDPAECSECGHVINSVVWAQYHDDEGNCHAHRAPV